MGLAGTAGLASSIRLLDFFRVWGVEMLRMLIFGSSVVKYMFEALEFGRRVERV